MTDKDIKDYCKNCDVEPPAMRFKCPECEHNPNNENNFAKDINTPYKEQIIIDGVDVSGCEYACNTAFGKNGCKHPMMKNIYCSKNPNCYYKQLQRKTVECEKYEQALDDIEKYQKRNCETCVFNKTDKCDISCQIFVILDIISKAKDGK